ncbi:collagen-like protein [Streptomyces sp. NPDC059708]|uniref:collagen-like triple helix repeat-containing protein n=1 Tax=Streptomyces sp. NPDC059708 TaxID=3346916 RepID=UPI0036C4E7D4
METVNFMDGRSYRAREFRRWFSNQQDGVAGFLTLDSFETKSAGAGRVTIGPGTCFIKEGPYTDPKKGLYHLSSDATQTLTLPAGLQYIWLNPLDLVDYPGDANASTASENNRFRFSTTLAGEPDPRALLIASVTAAGEVKDERFRPTYHQYLITRSGPARWGAPGSATVPLAQMRFLSVGTQYTDLDTGFRYVKIAADNKASDWVRDRGDKGDQGERGATGSKGATGSQGPKGDPGAGIQPDGSLSVTNATVTETLTVGSINVGTQLSSLASKTAELDQAVKDLAGKVRPGAFARCRAFTASNNPRTDVVWDRGGNPAPSGFDLLSDRTGFTCRKPGEYAISTAFPLGNPQSSTSTRVEISVNGDNKTPGNFATATGLPAVSVIARLTEGDLVSVRFASNVSFQVLDTSHIAIAPAF